MECEDALERIQELEPAQEYDDDEEQEFYQHQLDSDY